MKISLVLPSYNVSKYIDECLKSVIKQTLKDIEIICVDAGSNDGTLEIIKLYQEKDERIKLLMSEKKSYGYQMNLGIDNSKGEYIGIVETDDYIPENMCEELYAIAHEQNLDFIKADFYRFIRNSEHTEKVLNRIFKDKSMYNRVLNPEKEQGCFEGIMNTWSGIYKRSFLKNNNIRHNETLGASFQDNGFWFLTFMYAKRAYFYDSAYYMNRRDNLDSSVYSKAKICCICDEYEYIFSVMIKKKELLAIYGQIFIRACFNAYRGNYYRLAAEDRGIFIRRWSEDFKLFTAYIDNYCECLNEYDSETISRIVEDPEDYVEKNQLLEEKFWLSLKEYDNIIIFGAGMVGQCVLRQSIYRKLDSNLSCFAVSVINDNYSRFGGLAVRKVKDLMPQMRDNMIIIATLKSAQPEIRRYLISCGFNQIIEYPAEV